MKLIRKNYFLILIVIGSLWGLLEMISLPIWMLCTIGLMLLILGRKLVDITGTSIVIGLIACFYKTYGENFFICQWIGVMALAGSFEILVSLVFKSNWQKTTNTALIGVFTNIAALFLFVFAALVIIKEPNWISGGMQRIINYALTATLPASVISGVVTANLSLFISSKLEKYYTLLPGKLIPGLCITTILLLWITASIY